MWKLLSGPNSKSDKHFSPSSDVSKVREIVLVLFKHPLVPVGCVCAGKRERREREEREREREKREEREERERTRVHNELSFTCSLPINLSWCLFHCLHRTTLWRQWMSASSWRSVDWQRELTALHLFSFCLWWNECLLLLTLTLTQYLFKFGPGCQRIQLE